MDRLNAIPYKKRMTKSRERPERYEQHTLSFDGIEKPPRRLVTTEDIVRLHEALEPFLDIKSLRHAIAESTNIYEALRCDAPSTELRVLLDTLAVVLTPSPREQIKSPADVAGMMMLQLGALDHEEFWTVILDTKNRIVQTSRVYSGTIDTSVIRACEVFKEAVKRNAAAIVGCHNHPSQDCTPSPKDVLVTRRLVEASKILEVDFLDHIIVSSSTYVSLRERGFFS
jgi:DNA repair protein RadC